MLPHSSLHVQPRLKFIPEQFNPLVLSFAERMLPIVQRVRIWSWLPAGIAQVEGGNVEQLVSLYQQFQAGKIRLLLAFRHTEVDDPIGALALFSRIMPRVAREQGIPLQRPLHAHFAYDRGMTLWGGDWLGWLLSRFGGVAVRRGRRLDRVALQTLREKMLNGTMPLAIAPEGATNGHSEIVSPLQSGVAQLGFWCVEDLQKANRSETAIIVPIGIQYSYITPPWTQLERLLSQLEHDVRLTQDSNSLIEDDRETRCYHRICRLGEHLLSQMEQFYQRFTHHPLPDATTHAEDPMQQFDARLHVVLDRALSVAEQHFGLQAQGTLVDRCRRVEEEGWNDIYREDLPELKHLSDFDLGLADWIAAEAELRMRHMRLVESFVAVTAAYIEKKRSPERLAEMALLMFDLVSRIKGIKNPRRPQLGWRRIQLRVGEPIVVSDRWPAYQQNRQAAKQAVNQLTQELHHALQQLIDSHERVSVDPESI